MITVGSLFSGVGGIDEGLRRTGRFCTIWFSEIEPYCCEVLKQRFPGVPNVGDITKVDWDGIERPDMLVGGFPCQDISVAGKGEGIREGTRSGLWFEFARAIRHLRPKLVLVENVPMLLNRGMGIVLGTLAEAGYDAEWFVLSASEVGACHKRERVFIIAYSDGFGCSSGGGDREGRHVLRAEVGKASEAFPKRGGWLPRINKNASADAPDTDGKRIQGFRKGQVRRFPEFSWCENLRSVEDLRNRFGIPQPLIRGNRDGLPGGMDEADLEFRRERTVALGNSVVPACAQQIGEWILRGY